MKQMSKAPAESGLIQAGAILPDQMSGPFRRVLRYVSETLGMKEPSRVLSLGKLENEARVADVRPQALLVGPQLLASGPGAVNAELSPQVIAPVPVVVMVTLALALSIELTVTVNPPPGSA